MYICTSVRMCFCTSLLYFFCNQEQQGPAAPPGRWACSWARVPRGWGMGIGLNDKGCSPTAPEQGQKSRCVDSDQTSLQGQGRSKVRLGIQVRGLGSLRCRHPCRVAQARRIKDLRWGFSQFFLLWFFAPWCLMLMGGPWESSCTIWWRTQGHEAYGKCGVVSNGEWGPKPVEIILLSSPLSFRSGLAWQLVSWWWNCYSHQQFNLTSWTSFFAFSSV